MGRYGAPCTATPIHPYAVRYAVLMAVCRADMPHYMGDAPGARDRQRGGLDGFVRGIVGLWLWGWLYTRGRARSSPCRLGDADVSPHKGACLRATGWARRSIVA